MIAKIDNLMERTLPTAAAWLARYSIDLLRISLGLIIAGFGALKFFPGVSPAEGLVVPTVEALTMGVISGEMAMIATAIVEVGIGVTLVTGRFLKIGVVGLLGAVAGWMASLVVLFTDMFPTGGPTLEAQYVMKDIVFLAAALVVAAKVLGARFTSASDHDGPGRTLDRASVKLVA